MDGKNVLHISVSIIFLTLVVGLHFLRLQASTVYGNSDRQLGHLFTDSLGTIGINELIGFLAPLHDAPKISSPQKLNI